GASEQCFQVEARQYILWSRSRSVSFYVKSLQALGEGGMLNRGVLITPWVFQGPPIQDVVIGPPGHTQARAEAFTSTRHHCLHTSPGLTSRRQVDIAPA